MSDRIPKCASCGVKHPWLLGVSEIATRVSWQCNECGWHQTTEIPVNPRIGEVECVECDSQAIGWIDDEPYCQLHASTRESIHPDDLPEAKGSNSTGPSLFGRIASRIAALWNTDSARPGGDDVE